jgi:L-threonylcarbamoyladenylate synthase
MITNNIQHIVETLKKGDIVGIPTETVYGLGANGLDEKAVQKIFRVKGRPNKNPLILHTHSIIGQDL